MPFSSLIAPKIIIKSLVQSRLATNSIANMAGLFGFGKSQPRRVSTDHVVPIHHFDNSEVLRRLVVGWTTRFDDVLDANVLYQALEELIRRDGWCKMGGRLRLNVCKPEHLI